MYSMLLLWTDRPISLRSCRSAYRSPLWSSPGSPSLSRYTSIFFYSTVFKLSRLWNIRFRTSFLFFGSLVSEFTSPGLTLHNPRQSSTWVWFYTWHSSDLSSWVQGFQDLDGMQGQSQTLQTPIGVPGGSPQFRHLRPSGQDDAETHHELQGGRKFWMTCNLNPKDQKIYNETEDFFIEDLKRCTIKYTWMTKKTF